MPISSEWLEWKLLKTCIAIFKTCLQSLDLCARKIRNLRALFEVIRNAISISSLQFPNLRQISVLTCLNGCSNLHQATVHVERESVPKVPEI